MSETLLLLHGVTNSASIWDGVTPHLADDFHLVAPTATGHRGGPPMRGRATITSLIDDTERLLDERGLGAVHIAGNSMGGWMAIELARRGRALTVCALSPAGFWSPRGRDETHATSTIRRGRAVARATQPFAPLVLRSAAVRKIAFRDAVAHGDRMSFTQALNFTRDLAGCAAAADLLGTTEWIAPFDELPCPITLAWGARDRILPPERDGATARERLPGARYLELPDVGHVPMLDDPKLCADLIRQTASA
jgi:pimeloyl-ACP methyl ester carboxylesterase